MSRLEVLYQGDTPFDPFLYAEVGQDRNENSVSVLSALARLGLDPWDEAAALSDLPHDGATSRLGGLLARFTDVPSLDRVAVIARLVALLPQPSGRPTGASARLPSALATPGIGPIAAILVLILTLAQAFLSGE